MKKASTYYFALLALSNLGLGPIFMRFNRMMLEQFSRDFEGRAMPAATQLVASIPWWPFAFFAVCFVCLAGSIGTRFSSAAFCHVVIVVLAAEAFVLFWTTVGYAIPYVAIICN